MWAPAFWGRFLSSCMHFLAESRMSRERFVSILRPPFGKSRARLLGPVTCFWKFWWLVTRASGWLISLHIRSIWETICDAWACWSFWHLFWHQKLIQNRALDFTSIQFETYPLICYTWNLGRSSQWETKCIELPHVNDLRSMPSEATRYKHYYPCTHKWNWSEKSD